MRHHTVDSSVIREIGYDPAQRVLEVEFRTGRIYRYFTVPPAIQEQLLQASSVGEFFNREIRNAYPYVEVTTKGR